MSRKNEIPIVTNSLSQYSDSISKPLSVSMFTLFVFCLFTLFALLLICFFVSLFTLFALLLVFVLERRLGKGKKEKRKKGKKKESKNRNRRQSHH